VRGLIPAQRDSHATHKVRAFNRLIESVWGYSVNLNTHPAYADFRRRQAQIRAQGETPSGSALADTLVAYSEKGAAYVTLIRRIIATNRLEELDNALLHRKPFKGSSLLLGEGAEIAADDQRKNLGAVNAAIDRSHVVVGVGELLLARSIIGCLYTDMVEISLVKGTLPKVLLRPVAEHRFRGIADHGDDHGIFGDEMRVHERSLDAFNPPTLAANGIGFGLDAFGDGGNFFEHLVGIVARQQPSVDSNSATLLYGMGSVGEAADVDKG